MGEVLEIVIQNTGSLDIGRVDDHPFHAHGGHYYDIGSEYCHTGLTSAVKY